MTPRKFFMIMCGIIAILIVLIAAGVFGGNMIIKKQSLKLTDLKSKTKVVEDQQTSLNQAEKDIVTYKDLNNITRSIVPQDKDQAKTVREISKFASETGIALKDITFDVSNLGQAAATPSPAAEKNAAAQAPSLPPLTQVKPVEGIPGVYALELKIASEEIDPVPYDNFLNFLEKLESNRRTAHVTKIDLKPTTDGSKLSFSLTLNAYVKP